MDCLGLVIAFLRAEARYPVPDESALRPEDVTPEFWRCWLQLRTDETPREFDVIQTPGIRGVQHVGVRLRSGVLTTFQESGSQVVDLSLFTRLGIIGLYRWNGVACY
jgi:hypothetical protein